MSKNPVVHFEMPYKDANRVADFYTKTFGWKMDTAGFEQSKYIVAETTEVEHGRPKEPGAINGGFYSAENTAPAAVVISVENISEAMKKVVVNGGKVIGEPVDIPGIGKYVGFTDSEDNRVTLLEPLPVMSTQM